MKVRFSFTRFLASLSPAFFQAPKLPSLRLFRVSATLNSRRSCCHAPSNRRLHTRHCCHPRIVSTYYVLRMLAVDSIPFTATTNANPNVPKDLSGRERVKFRYTISQYCSCSVPERPSMLRRVERVNLNLSSGDDLRRGFSLGFSLSSQASLLLLTEALLLSREHCGSSTRQLQAIGHRTLQPWTVRRHKSTTLHPFV